MVYLGEGLQRGDSSEMGKLNFDVKVVSLEPWGIEDTYYWRIFDTDNDYIIDERFVKIPKGSALYGKSEEEIRDTLYSEILSRYQKLKGETA